MAIGRTFAPGVPEGDALARARRRARRSTSPLEELLERVARPGADRYDELLEALRRGATVERAARADLDRPVVPARARARSPPTRRRRSPACARSSRSTPAPPSSRRRRPTTTRPGSARRRRQRPPRGRARRRAPSVVILGSGPNRIGQGIEFDYCCVHAAMTVRESGRDAVMINCNPETVSTDYDTSDRLYFEPLTLEDVLAVIELEQPEGVIVQFGGQTPLRLAAGLGARRRARCSARASTRSTPPRTAAASARCSRGSATRRRRTRRRARVEEALAAARRRRLPAARAPELRARRPRDGDRLLARRPRPATCARSAPRGRRPRDLPRPLPRERDRGRRRRALRRRARSGSAASCSTSRRPGIHSGDSACVLPPHSLGAEMLERIREQTRGIALALGVVGLLNVQFAVARDRDELYVIEANPRASRTVPFVSKAIGAAAREARLPADARRADRRRSGCRRTR